MIPELTLLGQPPAPLTEQDQLMLECYVVEGWPQPAITWLLNGVPVFSSSRVEIITETGNTENGLYYVNSTFTIFSVITGDSGNYSCRANLGIPDTPSLVGTASVIVQGK